MTSSLYTYELIVSCNDPSFRQFYTIYEDSLPLRERKSKSQISAVLCQPDYKVLLLKRNDAVIGFSVLFVAVGENFSLLEYMAIHPSWRNAGLGGELFLRTFTDSAAGCGTSFGLVEVDSACELSDDLETRKRRELFYRRQGCLRIDGLSYLLPLPGEGPAPQMSLMVYFPGRLQTLWKCQLEQCLQVLYTKVYNCCPDDPRLRQMMRCLGDPVILV